MMSRHSPLPCRRGFTLVELLIVITIIIVLAALGLFGANRFIENGRKVKALAQFRDFATGMTMFETDYMKPPIPKSKRDTGWDTIYGDPGGLYSTQFLIAAMAGEEKNFPYGGETFSSAEVNPRNESYISFPYSAKKISGVGPDGRLYDPWGREVMVAINGFRSSQSTALLVEFNNGQNDNRLHTWKLAEYRETKPRDQSFVFWSYGKDGKKGKKAASPNVIVPLAGSDDVVSW